MCVLPVWCYFFEVFYLLLATVFPIERLAIVFLSKVQIVPAEFQHVVGFHLVHRHLKQFRYLVKKEAAGSALIRLDLDKISKTVLV